MTISAGDVLSALHNYATDDRKKQNEYFFKTGKGSYSEGDVFIGVRMPNIRIIAKQFVGIDLVELEKLITHEIHEVRLCALIILVLKYKKTKILTEKKIVLDFYLTHKNFVNNWDLVDVSVHYILGNAILDGLIAEEILDEFSQSKNMWIRRMSMVANWTIMRTGRVDITLRIAKKLLHDKQDLIHKAVGWMLREAWKKEPIVVENFLKENYKSLPRTTLRYAIERMEEIKRKQFLKGCF